MGETARRMLSKRNRNRCRRESYPDGDDLEARHPFPSTRAAPEKAILENRFRRVPNGPRGRSLPCQLLMSSSTLVAAGARADWQLVILGNESHVVPGAVVGLVTKTHGLESGDLTAAPNFPAAPRIWCVTPAVIEGVV